VLNCLDSLARGNQGILPADEVGLLHPLRVIMPQVLDQPADYPPPLIDCPLPASGFSRPGVQQRTPRCPSAWFPIRTLAKTTHNPLFGWALPDRDLREPRIRRIIPFRTVHERV